MTADQTLPAWLAVLVLAVAALLGVLGLVAMVRLRRRVDRELHRAGAELASLRQQLDEVERRHVAPSQVVDADGEFVITSLVGEPTEGPGPTPTPTVDARLFGDIVLREAVVQAASWAHGVRRALTPESRNRIRFEMKREVKRSRKQRRADVRQARREWEDRQRAGIDLGSEPQPLVSERPEDSAA